MPRLRWVSSLLFLLLAAACTRATRKVQLLVDARPPADGQAVATLDIPEGWTPLAPSASRLEYIGPDRRTRLYLRAMPAHSPGKVCPKAARAYAKEVIEAWGGPPRTRVVGRTEREDGVEFRLAREDPKPQGEVIWSRVVCQTGVLAVASCTLPGASQTGRLTAVCRDSLGSLEITPR